ncbi:MAG TPA: alpha-glucan family phosphorylase [Anaerolineales bacterium]|nr:alpha-glucan family phosphorylase [Anaerolineales bacterium]
MTEPETTLPNEFHLPTRLRRLPDLAYNLWWTWYRGADRVFRWLDREAWDLAGHNPVTFLRQARPEILKAATRNRVYLEQYDSVVRAFDAYMAGGGQAWYPSTYPDRVEGPIAYFSTEFGLHESLPIYAGGLGVLSGDHLKEASDLGMPVVALGFLYTQGYFRQRITEDGWQEAEYTPLSFTDLPVRPVLDQVGAPLTVSVDLPGRSAQARLWKIQIGRVPLYLLDSNIDSNQPSDRELTARLYTSDLESRISQEVLLGLGGVRALRALGYNPAVWHMNEGHSSFLSLERLRELVAAGRSFEEAFDRVRSATVFTTHTPVPAGHDEFPLWLIDKHFGSFWPQLGLDRDAFIDLARYQQPWGETFSMAILALRFSALRNGVSELHGEVARRMWSFVWPDRPETEVPISHITNGVHTGTWLARRMGDLYDRYLGPGWLERVDDPAIWRGADHIPDTELWEVRRHLKRKLAAAMRDRSRRLWLARRLHPVQVIASGALLDPYALTIGFARRFATYKRAHLLFHDFDRLLRLLHRPGMPLQVIYAGKAHPADEPGKRLIQEVYHRVKQAETGGRLVFVEDYDMDLARYLVQGVDVWLNTPRRPNEACGTSGQKAALNGALNVSVLDGWWREGYDGQNGWAIGGDEDTQDDEADADALYRLLEDEVLPLYYLERSTDEIPNEWLGRVRQSIQTLAPQFSMRRMVREYVHQMYHPARMEA